MAELRRTSVGGTEKGGSGLLSFCIHTQLTEQIGQEHATEAVWGVTRVCVCVCVCVLHTHILHMVSLCDPVHR